MENGFCPAEDSDLFRLHALTEPRLQPPGQAGDLVDDRTESSHTGRRTVEDGDRIARERIAVGVSLRWSKQGICKSPDLLRRSIVDLQLSGTAAHVQTAT